MRNCLPFTTGYVDWQLVAKHKHRNTSTTERKAEHVRADLPGELSLRRDPVRGRPGPRRGLEPLQLFVLREGARVVRVRERTAALSPARRHRGVRVPLDATR